MAQDPRTEARSLMQDVQDDDVDLEAAQRLHDLLEADDTSACRLAVNALRSLNARNSDLLVEVVDRDLATVRSLTTSDDPSVRAGAAALVGSVWSPDALPAEDAVAALAPLLTDEAEFVRGSAVSSLRTIGSVEPGAVVSAAPAAADLLDQPGGVRRDACTLLAQAAMEDGEVVAPYVERLLELFATDRDGAESFPTEELRGREHQPASDRMRELRNDTVRTQRVVRQRSGMALAAAATARPSAVLPFADDVAALLDDEDPQVRHAAASVLVALAEAEPGVAADHADRIGGLLEPAEAESVVDVAVQGLAVASPADPDRVRSALADRLDLVYDRLDHDQAPARGAAATLLAVVAETDPSVLEPAEEDLRDLADGDEPEYVRAAAADALRAGE